MVTTAYNAASGATDWTQEYTGPQSGGGALAVAVNPDGATVFVTGSVQDAQGNREYATVAYQAATGATAWAQVHSGANGSLGDDSAARSLAVSPDGATVFVTGTLTTTAGESYGTLAYDASTGTQQWLELYQVLSSNESAAAALAVSPDGSAVFVTGTAGGSYGTVAYDAATGAQQWVDLYHPAEGAFGESVVVSSDSATVFVTGYSSKAHQSTHYATFAYAAATGATRWLQLYPGPRYPTGFGEGHAVAVSPDGSAVFVTGLLQNPLNQPSEYATFAYEP